MELSGFGWVSGFGRRCLQYNKTAVRASAAKRRVPNMEPVMMPAFDDGLGWVVEGLVGVLIFSL